MKWKLILGTVSAMGALAANGLWWVRAQAMLEPGSTLRLDDIKWLIGLGGLLIFIAIQSFWWAAVDWLAPRLRRIWFRSE